MIGPGSDKNYFTADHQDPDRRKCCVLLLVGATQLFQHCRPVCSSQWGSRNPGIFLWYFLKWWCWSLNRWSCWRFITVLIDLIFFRRRCWFSSPSFTSLLWVQSAQIPSCKWQSTNIIQKWSEKMVRKNIFGKCPGLDGKEIWIIYFSHIKWIKHERNTSMMKAFRNNRFYLKKKHPIGSVRISGTNHWPMNVFSNLPFITCNAWPLFSFDF